ncbi:MAG: ATP-binding protein [Candidatus Omnitrophota bacterium]
MNLDTIGKAVGKIPVHISYNIIELFSGNLYSSPNKAFEELVCNSYDAFAQKVAVYVPSDLSKEDSALWVCDNGESMDSAGLKLLWKIGASNKRAGDYDEKGRPQIGKFGIGKLATYVLSRKLTYICKAKEEFRAVTMDYGRIDPRSEEAKAITLDEKSLTEQEVIRLLRPLVEVNGRKLLDFDLWGEKAEKSWTFVIMSDLKPKAQQIQEGRLKWILSTALPLSPNFSLYFNGTKIEPSKAGIAPIKTWIIGKDDEVAKKFEYTAGEFNGKPCVNLQNIKNIYGEAELYNDSLVKGKSEKLGRSHGIFLMVRGRLVNIDDPLLGMNAMTHGVFNRFRMVIHADGLDDELASTRESIKDSVALNDVQRYIQRKFDEIRTYYFALVENEEMINRAAYKVSHSAASLSRRPLLIVARKFFNKEIDNLLLTNIPPNLSKEAQEDVISKLEEDLTSETGIIKDVVWDVMDPEDPVAKFDLIERKARINLLHPFFANFLDEVKSKLPFQLIAITEILTEAFLIESGISQDQVGRIMWQRDQLLRDLTFSDKPNAPLVCQMIKGAVSNPDGLEDSVFCALNCLGFETTKIGGPGKPDGKAVAILGVLDAKSGVKADYSLTYDAKSTSKDKIKASTAHVSGVDRHRDDYNANYALVVAIDFEGAMDPDSAVSKEAKKHKITLLRAGDLINLVLVSAPKQLGFLDFKDLFENCHTVIETSQWIENIKKKEVAKLPIKELLETIYKLMKEDKEVIELAGIRLSHPELKKYRKEDIKSLVNSLEILVGNLISLKGEMVSIQAPPEKILECINKVVTTEIPHEFTEVYMKFFDSSKAKNIKE